MRTLVVPLGLVTLLCLGCSKEAEVDAEAEKEALRKQVKDELKQELAAEAEAKAAADAKKLEELKKSEIVALRGHCPEGRAAQGGMPPTAYERWCELTDVEGRPNGIKDGVYESWHKNGQPLDVTTYVAGKAQGPSSRYWDNGNKELSGTMKDGLYVGVLETYSYEGPLATRVEYNDAGQFHGVSTTYYADGSTYVQYPYQNGVAHGQYLEYYDGGAGRLARDGMFVNGVQDGIWNRYDLYGAVVGKESYVGGIMQAIVCEGGAIAGQEATKEGTESACYLNGFKEGPAEERYPSGNLLRQGTYRTSKKDGLWVAYFDDPIIKKKAEVAYVNGQRDGWFTSYWDDGVAIRTQGQYVRGKSEGVWVEYFKNGTRESQGSAHGGDKSGAWNFWYENGNMREAVEYWGDKKNGYGVRYHDNGVGSTAGWWADGVRVGTWEYWDRDGSYLGGEQCDPYCAD